MTETEIAEMALKAVEEATRAALEAYPDGSDHRLILEAKRIGFENAYLQKWLETVKFKSEEV